MLRSDVDLEGRRVTEFLKELSAVAARGGGDGECNEAGATVDGEVREEKLLGVDGMVKG